MRTKTARKATRMAKRPQSPHVSKLSQKGKTQKSHHASVAAELTDAPHNEICQLEWAVTELRQRMEAMGGELDLARKSAAHYQDLFQLSPVAYLVHDEAGKIFDLNAMAARLLGLKRVAQGIRAQLSSFVCADDLRALLQHLRACRNSRAQRRVEVRLRLGNGRTRPVEILSDPVISKSRSNFRVRTLITDLSARVAADTALAERREDFHALVDTIDGIVCEIDVPTMDITFVSRYAQRFLGYPLDLWRRPGFWESRVFPEDRARVGLELARIISEKQPAVLEYRVISADRRVFWVHDSVSALERKGRLKLICVAVDISERKMAEQALRRSQEQLEQRVEERTAELRTALGDLESFSYSVSHDMRGPIRAVCGYAEVLQRMLGANPPPEAHEFLHRIQASAERLDLLVRDVLNYSRVIRSPWEPTPVDLDEVVESVLRDHLNLQQADIEVQRPLGSVLGHEIFLAQIVSNLLSNAVKFTRPGEKPEVRLWTEESRGARAVTAPTASHTNGPAAAAGAHGWLRLSVKDQGIGISARDQSRIFGLFQRLNPENQFPGTGIGLAIVQKAAARMGGRVGVSSEPGKGSAFWVDLPRAVVTQSAQLAKQTASGQRAEFAER